MGSDDDKNQLIADIKGVSYETVQNLFAFCANAISCIYLTHLNTVQNLKTIMNINDTYAVDFIVCKCGFSNKNKSSDLFSFRSAQRINSQFLNLIQKYYIFFYNFSHIHNIYT